MAEPEAAPLPAPAAAAAASSSSLLDSGTTMVTSTMAAIQLPITSAMGLAGSIAEHPAVTGTAEAATSAIAHIAGAAPILISRSIARLSSLLVPADYTTTASRAAYVKGFHSDLRGWLLAHHENLLDVFGTEQAYAAELALRLRAVSTVQFLDAVAFTVGEVSEAGARGPPSPLLRRRSRPLEKDLWI